MTQALNCPHCKGGITIDETNLQNQYNQLQNELEQQKKQPKIPSFIPDYPCEDGSCGRVHENSHYAHRPKGKCSNCDQFSPEKEGKCAWCKQTDSIEEIDKDEIEDLGIRLPG